jgi:hypothetical protein
MIENDLSNVKILNFIEQIKLYGNEHLLSYYNDEPNGISITLEAPPTILSDFNKWSYFKDYTGINVHKTDYSSIDNIWKIDGFIEDQKQFKLFVEKHHKMVENKKEKVITIEEYIKKSWARKIKAK